MENKIKEIRLRQGYTQEALAEKADVSVKQLQRIEIGKADARISTLESIAIALNVTIGSLLKEK